MTGWGRRVSWLALAAALTPIVATVVRAWSGDRVPAGDAGYFVARSRDVLTEHHPLIGAFSSGSVGAGAEVNNLGPLQLDLLAPFTKIDASWGAALGAGLLNAAAVVAVWLVARRLFAAPGVIAAMLATLAVEASLGADLLVDTRQQTALLLPFWAFLWLVGALVAGAIWALPWAALVASLLVQTHFSYVYQTAILSVVGLVAVVAVNRATVDARRWVTYGAATAAVLAVCWWQPIWDQVAGTGNLGRALGAADGSGMGTAEGARLVAEAVLIPPFWTPGGMEHYLDNGLLKEPAISVAAALLAILGWTVGGLATVVIARRRGRASLAALAVVALVALGAGWFTAARLPAHPQAGPLPQNYFWMWPTGVLLTLVVAGGVACALGLRLDRLAPAPALAATVALVVVAAVVARPAEYWQRTSYEADVGPRLLDQLRASLARYDVDEPVVMTFFWGVGIDDFSYVMLTEFQRAGVEFVFPADNPNVRRFGDSRCMDGTERLRVRIIDTTRVPPLAEDDRLLAAVDLLDPAEAAELDALDDRIASALRSGEIGVDQGLADYFRLEVPQAIAAVVSDTGRSASGLAAEFAELVQWDAIKVDPALTDEWARWQTLEEDARNRRLALVLSPLPSTSRLPTCS